MSSPRMDAWTTPQQGGLLGGALMVYTWDVAEADDDVVARWYVHEHLPERVSTPGFLRGRRYERQPGAAGQRYLTVYETEDVDVFRSREYLRRLNSPSELTTWALTRFVDPSRSVCRTLASHGSGAGRELSVVRFDAEPEHDLASWLTRSAPEALTDARLCGVHLAEVDVDATAAKATTSEGRGVAETRAEVQQILLVDGIGGTAQAADRLAAAAPVPAGGDVGTYDLLVTLDHDAFATDRRGES